MEFWALVVQVSLLFPTETGYTSWLGIGEVCKNCDIKCCVSICL